jgi:replicative DNA helicase
MIDIFASDLRPMEYWALKAEQKLNQWESGIVDGRSTGFRTLDPMLRLIDSELILIAARPSMGKSALAMQIAENVGRQLKKENDTGVVAVFSAEMSGTELYIRMVAAFSGVNAHKLRYGKGTQAEKQQFRDGIRTLRSLPIWMDDSSGPSTAKMLEQLERLNETMPIRMMVFDFVELGGDKAPKEDLRISTILQNLKGIAKTLNIPVVGLNQLNRDVDNRSNRMPSLSDLRYSGMAEQIADKVVFIMRPEYYIERQETIDVPDKDKKGIAYIIVAKNRNGPVGVLRLAFVKEKSMFAELERETPA